jgi:hypothetical protein
VKHARTHDLALPLEILGDRLLLVKQFAQIARCRLLRVHVREKAAAGHRRSARVAQAGESGTLGP